MSRSPKPPLSPDRGQAPPSSATPTSGDTRVSRQPGAGPRLPHEHDESADSQALDKGRQRQVGEQAHADLEHGLVDTSRQTELEEVYDENLRIGEGGAPPGGEDDRLERGKGGRRT